jgi:hypothetical protein
MISELESKWEKAIVPWVIVPSRHLPGGSEKNKINPFLRINPCTGK